MDGCGDEAGVVVPQASAEQHGSEVVGEDKSCASQLGKQSLEASYLGRWVPPAKSPVDDVPIDWSVRSLRKELLD